MVFSTTAELSSVEREDGNGDGRHRPRGKRRRSSGRRRRMEEPNNDALKILSEMSEGEREGGERRESERQRSGGLNRAEME